MDNERNNGKSDLFKTKEGKIIILIFSVVLVVVGIMDFFGIPKRNDIQADNTTVSQQQASMLESVRNKRIDSITAYVTREKDSPYTQSDIDSAVEVVKQDFKQKPQQVSLAKIKFDEKRCVELRDSCESAKEYEKSDVIVLLCDYNVYEDYAAWTAGYYENWNMILARESSDDPWGIIDCGY